MSASFRAGLKAGLARRLLQGYQNTGDIVWRWTRLDYHGPARLPDGPALLVANHGFGTVYDMNALVVAALLRRHAPAGDVPVTILAHQAAWTLGLGQWLEPAGLVRASRDNARAALARGHLVVVLPGGDLDAAKDFRRRHTVVFGGRTGFAALAIEAGVPVVPLVITGAGDTALVLNDGQRLARWLQLPRLLRLKTLPISLSIPWGLSVGVAGMAAPYLPLPAKMQASVLEAMHPGDEETAQAFAARVQAAMNTRMAELTAGRLPILGWRWPTK